MPRVEAFTIDGLDLWFNSADHAPAHFHARKPGQWEIRVNILATTPETLAFSFEWPRRGASVSARIQKLLRDATIGYRLALLAEWDEKVLRQEGV